METPTPSALTVSQLNQYIKEYLDHDFVLRNVTVTAEISEFKRHYKSGHCYFTLKDDRASISCAMFAQNARSLRFEPEPGMKVLVTGNVSIYPARGDLQLYVRTMQPDGIGSLALAFEQLKEKLQKEGLFAEECKKPIPVYPQRIGVVSAPTAAAFHDICNVLTRRWPVADIILSPTLVQGDAAPPQIVKAIEAIDRAGVDVILVARGGGSLEDLWCFNDERVARAIFACQTPVISGVGHEVDFTIADFVADLRAPTPSAAAELCAPERFDESDRILQMQNRMRFLTQQRINQQRARVLFLQQSNVLQSFGSLLNVKRMDIDRMTDSLQHSMRRRMDAEHGRLNVTAGKLDAFSPLKVISRGYGVVRKEDGNVVASVDAVTPGSRIAVTVRDGSLDCTVDTIRKEVP